MKTMHAFATTSDVSIENPFDAWRSTILLFGLVAIITLCSCGRTDLPSETPSTESSTQRREPDSIGMATMEQDGTIVLLLRAEEVGGTTIGDACLQYPPTHPDYQEILSHLGAIKPGESKPVLPWPENTLHEKEE